MPARPLIAAAYRFLFSERRSLGNLAAMPLLLVLAGNLLPGSIGADYELAVGIGNLVALLALTQFARVVYGGLAAARPPQPRDFWRVDGRSWSLLWHGVVAGIVALIPVGVALAITLVALLAGAFGGGTGGELVGWIVMPPGILLSLWLLLRFALVPAFCVSPGLVGNQDGPFIAAWRLSRGRVWLIAKLLAATVLPFLPAQGLLMLLLGQDFGSFVMPVAFGYGALVCLLQLALIAVSAHALVALILAPRAAPAPAAAAA